VEAEDDGEGSEAYRQRGVPDYRGGPRWRRNHVFHKILTVVDYIQLQMRF
jgi:hypothetical protein